MGEIGRTYPLGDLLAGSYENCQADAFHTAVATLQSRAKTWGAKSPELANWIKAQDAVFSNCNTGSHNYYGAKADIRPSNPTQAPSDAPLLLRQDRAYQIAAAQFYASQLAPARAGFQSIAEDRASPWRGIAAYLVARCLIREAYLSAEPGNGPDDNTATFKPDLMDQAQKQLEFLRGQLSPGISAHAVQQMLNLVRLRTEPEARLRELSTALGSPKADANYVQDLNDLTWYLNGKLPGVRPEIFRISVNKVRSRCNRTTVCATASEPADSLIQFSRALAGGESR